MDSLLTVWVCIVEQYILLLFRFCLSYLKEHTKVSNVVPSSYEVFYKLKEMIILNKDTEVSNSTWILINASLVLNACYNTKMCIFLIARMQKHVFLFLKKEFWR